MRRPWPLAAALALGLALAGPGVAQNAYAPAYTVNDSVITHYDIEQRTRLLEALGATGDVRELAVEQLKEDRVKVQAGREAGIELSDEDITAGIEEFAEQRGISVEDVNRVLAARGIDRQTLRDFVEAGVTWRELVSSRFRSRAMPTPLEIDRALDLAEGQPVEIVRLAEIAIPFAEHGEAETVALADRIARDIRSGAMSFDTAVSRYSRSGSAAQGGALPAMPATQLPPALRGQVLLMETGQITDPIPISGGLAILRLVSIDLEQPEDLPDVPEAERRRQLREQLFNQRITNFGQGYLQDLLGDALIVEQ